MAAAALGAPAIPINLRLCPSNGNNYHSKPCSIFPSLNVHFKRVSISCNGMRPSNRGTHSSTPIRVIGPDHRLLHLGTHNGHNGRGVVVRSGSSSSGGVAWTVGQSVLGFFHLVVSLGLILAMDKFLKQAFVTASIKFPSALFGMFCVFSILVTLDTVVPVAATSLMDFFQPALLFIQRWLPFLLASTVLGYMVGSGLPSEVKKVFHPIICCALSADLAALAFGYFSYSGIEPVLGYYLTKVSSNPGAGDILMGFLGSVIISFAFSMFTQRKLIRRHAAEIFTSIIIATLFSLYSTALMGRLLGLERALTISILPRCITVALALSIVSFFEGANSSLTAATVVVTGLVGANFVQATLDKLQFRDPIARGIATASSAHGLGTAALSAKEPEALPFCAIAYALTGIFGSVICSVPAVRQNLLAIVG